MLCRALFMLALLALPMRAAHAQVGGHKLFGDLKVDESQTSERLPISYEVLLYTYSGNLIGRLSIPNRGRYQFLSLADGEYYIAVEVENKEITRVRVSIFSPFRTDFRKDIELEWREHLPRTTKTGTISATDSYKRSDTNQKLFSRAQRAADDKKYDQAAALLQEVTRLDPVDFQAWVELGNVHFLQGKLTDAENEYIRAMDARPRFFLALLNLGRVEVALKSYDVAVAALTRAVGIRPESVEANYLLGEAYLHLKQGSLAVTYLKEALRLDPQAMAEVHLRLALLYHRAGMKDKAAGEYQEFLKKRPAYADRKKLEKYIAANIKKT
ncbi:MAG: tetratricopeptide repeat protein [Acidobacteriota bacterium]